MDPTEMEETLNASWKADVLESEAPTEGTES